MNNSLQMLPCVQQHILNSAAKAVLYPNSSIVAGHVDALLRGEAHANSQAYILFRKSFKKLLDEPQVGLLDPHGFLLFLL